MFTPSLTAISLFFLCGPRVSEAAETKDIEWLQKKGTLIFEEAFEREEEGNGATALGNGWNSATADRVPHIKQADLDHGILKVQSATKEAGHGAHIHHPAEFTDGGVWLRFKFPGVSTDELFQVGFVDRECKGVHAGHLCYAVLSVFGKSVTLKDWKTGRMQLDLRARAEEARKASGKVPEDLQALFNSKECAFPWTPDNNWHELLLVTEGDQMRVCMDGKPFADFRSAGFAHSPKRWLSLNIPASVWVDEIKVWKVR